MRRGPCFRSCRTSSEPIEPPAPVTRIDLSRVLRASRSALGGTLSRPSRSLTSSGPQVGDADAARRDVLDRRQDLHLDRVDPASSLRMRRRSRRRSSGSATRISRTSWRSISGREPVGMVDLEARHVLAPQRRLGIDEGDGVAVVGAAQRVEQLHAELAGAEDDHRPCARRWPASSARRMPALSRIIAGDFAAAGDQQRRQNAVAEHDRARDAQLAGHEYDQRPDQHRQPDAADDAGMAAIAEIARHAAVETGERRTSSPRSAGALKSSNAVIQIGRHVERRCSACEIGRSTAPR